VLHPLAYNSTKNMVLPTAFNKRPFYSFSDSNKKPSPSNNKEDAVDA
jgi:hypothetical protein